MPRPGYGLKVVVPYVERTMTVIRGLQGLWPGEGFLPVLPLQRIFRSGRRPEGAGSSVQHRWDLPILCYHEIMIIYPYPFLVVITQFFSYIIFINGCICILTGSPG